MKRIALTRTLLICGISAFAVVGAAAQETKPDEMPHEGNRPGMDQPQDPRFNLLRQLGLSREQIQRIRRMNMARRPLLDAAQDRFREASRLLDQAIYADQVNEEDVKARVKDVQLAQAEMIRIRSMDELAVRQLLTPEQLVRFRELRARFDRVRENFQNGRPMQRKTPENAYRPMNATDQPSAPAKEKP